MRILAGICAVAMVVALVSLHRWHDLGTFTICLALGYAAGRSR